MFGNDASQQSYAAPSGAQTNDEEAVKDGSLEQPDTSSVAQDNNQADSQAANVFAATVATDPFGTMQPAAMPAPTATVTPSQPVAATASDDAEDTGLLSIKQQALQQLSPLVNQLDQTAEDKFKTTMMMIQASDDQSLIPVAFEAAKQIEDDKVRAQALLDIINEINYFTQQ